NRGSSPVTIFNGTPAARTVPGGAIVSVNNVPSSGDVDNGPVNQAIFDSPQGLFVTGQGVYVVDSNGGPKVPATINGEDTSLLKFINTTSSAVTIYSGAGANAISVPPSNIAVIAGVSSSRANSGFSKHVTLKGASDVPIAPNSVNYITDVRNMAV